MFHQKTKIDLDKFYKLAEEGLSCKVIAMRLGVCPKSFGISIKKLIGIYPSVYLAKLHKRGVYAKA